MYLRKRLSFTKVFWNKRTKRKSHYTVGSVFWEEKNLPEYIIRSRTVFSSAFLPPIREMSTFAFALGELVGTHTHTRTDAHSKEEEGV